jgi:hypothetical protein
MFCATQSKSLNMKRLILFTAIFCGLAAITQAQTTEKIKTKIEGQGFKKKTKTEGDAQHVLMSTSAHPAYVHHSSVTKHHYASAKRYTPTGERHLAHVRSSYAHVSQHKSMHAAHYKKIKRTHKNGEYKVKYKA